MACKEQYNNKLVVVLGPNAAGKSDLAVWLAKKFDGEVVSADSRQIYKGMDIGTGKITPDTKNSSNFSTGQVKKKCIFTHKGVPHHLLDVASPKRRFTVAQYQKKANEAIRKIHRKGKLPILCGGTGFYIQAVVDGIVIPSVKPDWNLRKILEKQTCQQLFKKLKKLDQKRAKNIDRYNKRRLVRAIEIVHKTKRPVPALKKEQKFDVLMIGIKKDRSELRKRIAKRLEKRLRQGMVREVEGLRKSGVSWKRLEEFGLEYKFVAFYLQGKIEYGEMVDKLQKAIENYAKKQMTWFKRNKKILWLEDKNEAEKLLKKFLKK
jgi:tRNA dimethylallyltransferase